MLLSMRALAQRNQLDISGTQVEVTISTTEKPVLRFNGIDVTVSIPRAFSEKNRMKLERAAELCPIKHSFDPAIPISVQFDYGSGSER